MMDMTRVPLKSQPGLADICIGQVLEPTEINFISLLDEYIKQNLEKFLFDILLVISNLLKEFSCLKFD